MELYLKNDYTRSILLVIGGCLTVVEKTLGHASSRRVWRMIAVALSLWLALFATPVAADSGPDQRPELVFTTFSGQGMGTLFGRILSKAYARIGYRISIRHAPAARALRLSDCGKVDGEAARAPVIEKRYRNLIRVPTPLYRSTIVVYTKLRSIDTGQGWDALRPHKVGAVLGYKFIEKKTRCMDRILSLSHDQLFAMLDNGRVDVAVSTSLEALGNYEASKSKGICALAPPLSRQFMYHYLHRKHAPLVPVIDASLRKLREDGTMKALELELIEELLAR